MGTFPSPGYSSDWISGGKIEVEGTILAFENEGLSVGESGWVLSLTASGREDGID